MSFANVARHYWRNHYSRTSGRMGSQSETSVPCCRRPIGPKRLVLLAKPNRTYFTPGANSSIVAPEIFLLCLSPAYWPLPRVWLPAPALCLAAGPCLVSGSCPCLVSSSRHLPRVWLIGVSRLLACEELCFSETEGNRTGNITGASQNALTVTRAQLSRSNRPKKIGPLGEAKYFSSVDTCCSRREIS